MKKSAAVELVTPRILIVDDERQIHSSLRLRLEKTCEVVSCYRPSDALAAVTADRFDLCIVDIHMPEMDGLTFIENAQRVDGALGYVVLSAFASPENLRRTIPLHVFDFISKPLPERDGFEALIPHWVERTRARRRDQELVRDTVIIYQDLDSARLEREAELIASETARDALLQTANLLTTIQAHLVGAAAAAATRAKKDPGMMQLWRNLEEARKTSDAATTVAESFFNSAYASRDSSPALIEVGVRQAIGIASRMSSAEATNKAVDLHSVIFDARLPVQGINGIEFLLMIVPVIGAALLRAAPNTTVGISIQHLSRLEVALKDSSLRQYLWVNRRHAHASHAGVLITITAAAAPLTRAETEAWLRGDPGPISTISPRGLAVGIQKCRGLLAVSLLPQSEKFQLVLALPA